MSTTITVTRQDKNDIYLAVLGTIALSGNYAAGGEAITVPGLKTSKGSAPLSFEAEGRVGYIYQYNYTTNKLLVMCNTAGGAKTALAEFTDAQAYSSGTPDATTDVISFRAQYRTP